MTNLRRWCKIVPVVALCGCVSVPSQRKPPHWLWFRVTDVVSPVLLRVGGIGVVRLRGVAPPERFRIKAGPLWRRAVDKLRSLTKNRLVRMEPPPWGPLPDGSVHEADVFVRISDAEQLNLAAEMVRLGLLRLSKDYRHSKYHILLKNMEEEARSHARGLWATPKHSQNTGIGKTDR